MMPVNKLFGSDEYRKLFIYNINICYHYYSKELFSI